jgi:shikimate dehydrogenase
LVDFMDISLIENQIDISNLDQYAAIIGECPSKGARSPKLWNAVFEYEKRNCKMLPLDVKKENITNLLNNLNSNKEFIGGAIAVPYKEVVAKWLGDNITPEAKKIGAVNCLYRNSYGILNGTNTDGEASLVTFKDKFGSIENKSVMVLGVGGAGKAVSSYFSSTSINTIIISRCESGKPYAYKIGAEWGSWDEIDNSIPNVDVIINCTSIGFGDQESKSPLNEKQIAQIKDSAVIFDIIYQPLKTKLLEMAGNRSISTFNGLTMNLEQAVLAYKYAVNSYNGLDEIRKIMERQ